MKKQKFSHRIPRPLAACISAVCVLALLLLGYIAIGCPTLTFRQEFRRAEKANLVGPSTIVDELDGTIYADFPNMYVGESDYGITFFGLSDVTLSNGRYFNKKQYIFSYQEKTGDITLAIAPNHSGVMWGDWGSYVDIVNLPVYVFTEHTDAARAEVTIRVNGAYTKTVNGEKKTTEFSETFTAKASAIDDGIFRCFLQSKTDKQCHALYYLSRNVCDRYPSPDVTITAMVWLYDEDGNIIVAQSVDIPSA